MTTVTCNYKQYCDMVRQFRTAMTTPSNTNEEVATAHKCLVLHYLGMNEDDKIDTAAMLLKSSTSEVMRRGWELDADVLGEF